MIRFVKNTTSYGSIVMIAIGHSHNPLYFTSKPSYVQLLKILGAGGFSCPIDLGLFIIKINFKDTNLFFTYYIFAA